MIPRSDPRAEEARREASRERKEREEKARREYAAAAAQLREGQERVRLQEAARELEEAGLAGVVTPQQYRQFRRMGLTPAQIKEAAQRGGS